jgi:choline dehydrogenase
MAARAVYATSGLPGATVARPNSSTADIDLFNFGRPVDFTSYFHDWNEAAVANHKH